MRPVSGPAFERLLRSTEPAEFRRFVADLWAGRGWQTAIEGDLIVATDDTGRTQRILVRHSSGPSLTPSGTDVDYVVTDAPTRPQTTDAPFEAVRVLDPADLRNMLLYGLDRDTATELVRRHFDRSLASPRTTGTSLDGWVRIPETSPASMSKVLAVVVVVLLLAHTLLGGPAGFATTGDEGTPAATPPPTDTAAVDETLTFRPVAASTLNASALPPGLGAEGITDTRAVTRATAAALANRSFRWELTSRTSVDGQETEVSRRVVTVNRPTVYAATVRRPDGSESDTTVIEGAYADGRTHIERFVADGETTYCARPVTSRRAAADSYADRIEQRLGWLLVSRTSELTGTAIRNGTTVYRVRLSSERWSDIEELTGIVLIDAEGVVRELRTTYTSSRSASRKTIVVAHRLEFGVAAVPPPPWYAVARAVTDPTTESC